LIEEQWKKNKKLLNKNCSKNLQRMYRYYKISLIRKLSVDFLLNAVILWEAVESTLIFIWNEPHVRISMPRIPALATSTVILESTDALRSPELSEIVFVEPFSSENTALTLPWGINQRPHWNIT
jgi:hypothetical protein